MAHCRFVEVKCFISQLEKKINIKFDRVSLNVMIQGDPRRPNDDSQRGRKQ